MNNEESKIQESENPQADTTSTDSALRYTAYASRLRTILMASHRYVAYTSDIGESFRPVAHPLLVRFCYGISWTYIIGDVNFESWRAKMRQEGRYYSGLKPWDPKPEVNIEARDNYSDLDWRLVGLKRLLFQSIASMGLPAFTIHSTVRYSPILFKHFKNSTVKGVGPVVCGLAVVPLLPYLFDEPVEKIMDRAFEEGYNYYKRGKLD